LSEGEAIKTIHILGKSTLVTALYRLVNLESGSIEIDGHRLDQLKLKDIRTNISVIPQDPVLFVGTVRYNLDPFDQYDDAQLWKALESTHVKRAIEELPDKLQSEVVENGENFSVGQRQLLCMARAILRNSKIILLDEATAAIDTETDSLVQETIKTEFSHCTMLTIAHRLNTVLTCDKILVMGDGEVLEFNEPSKLLQDPNSEFAKMVATSSASTSALQNRGEAKVQAQPKIMKTSSEEVVPKSTLHDEDGGIKNESFVPERESDPPTSRSTAF